MKLSLSSVVDTMVGVVSPQAAYRRSLFREAERVQSSRLRYDAARVDRLRGQAPTSGHGSGDSEMTEAELRIMRARSRVLDQNNWIFASIHDRVSEAVFGAGGLKVSVNSKNKTFNRKVEELWTQFWTDKPEVRKLHDGPELEDLIFRSAHVDGDVGIARTSKGLQVFEADRICTPKEHLGDKNVIDGVRLDDVGAPVEYYVADYDDRRYNQAPVDFDTFQAKDFILYAPTRHRVSSTRGVPGCARNYELFEDILAFIEASIIHQKIASAYVLAIKKENPFAAEQDITEVTRDDGSSYSEEEVNPGSILRLKNNEDAKGLGPGQSAQQFVPFVSQLMRFAGLMYGLPLELVSLDFSKTNYSSGRASMLVSLRAMRRKQLRFVSGFLSQILEWKIDDWIAEGALTGRPAGNYSITVAAPRAISLDPLKEVKADIERISHSLSSHKQVAHANGADWSEPFLNRAEEIKFADKIAKELVKLTGEKWSARDILNLSDLYNEKVFESPEAKSDQS